MKLPRLNRRLVLEDPQKLFDGAGGFTITWTTLGTIWAEVKPRAGRERLQGAAPVSTVPVTITTRAETFDSPARPKAQQRFRDGNRIYTIQAVTEHFENDLYLVCQAVEEIVG